MTDEAPPKRKRGGQPKPATERKRNNLTFRVRDNLRAQLQASADENQRSLSEEIEYRLEHSFAVAQPDMISPTVKEAIDRTVEATLTRVFASRQVSDVMDIGKPVRRRTIIPLDRPIRAPEGPLRTSPSPGKTSPSPSIPGHPTRFEIKPEDFDTFERLVGEIEAAHTRGDLAALRTRVTPAMLSQYSEAFAERGFDEIAHLKLLQSDLSESWREDNTEYAAVRMRFELKWRYVERATGKVVERDGDKPIEVTKLWTFLRSRGGSWLLSDTTMPRKAPPRIRKREGAA